VSGDVQRRLAEASANDLLIAIHRAIEARDFEAVAAFLHVLAVKDPHAAQDVLDLVAVAKLVAR
jgi:hypothetical protein